jgi:hypothetical protein
MLPLLLIAALATTAAACTSKGLTGFPALTWNPLCASACLRSLSSLHLSCTGESEMVGMVMVMTTTECYAENEAFLTSLAWCVNVECADGDYSSVLLEYFWDEQATGQKSAGQAAVPAKWTYAEALSHVTSPPTFQLLQSDTHLNRTSLVPPETYRAQLNVLSSVQEETIRENGYGYEPRLQGI